MCLNKPFLQKEMGTGVVRCWVTIDFQAGDVLLTQIRTWPYGEMLSNTGIWETFPSNTREGLRHYIKREFQPPRPVGSQARGGPPARSRPGAAARCPRRGVRTGTGRRHPGDGPGPGPGPGPGGSLRADRGRFCSSGCGEGVSHPSHPAPSFWGTSRHPVSCAPLEV